MTTKLEQAALDLLEGVEAAIKAGDWKVDGACDPDLAMYRLREALAEQAEQEPVAWIDNKTWCFTYSQYEYEDLDDDMTDDLVPLYAAPVRTKDLTDDEVAKIKGFYAQASFETIVRAAIAADREKNK